MTVQRIMHCTQHKKEQQSRCSTHLYYTSLAPCLTHREAELDRGVHSWHRTHLVAQQDVAGQDRHRAGLRAGRLLCLLAPHLQHEHGADARGCQLRQPMQVRTGTMPEGQRTRDASPGKCTGKFFQQMQGQISEECSSQLSRPCEAVCGGPADLMPAWPMCSTLTCKLKGRLQESYRKATGKLQEESRLVREDCLHSRAQNSRLLCNTLVQQNTCSVQTRMRFMRPRHLTSTLAAALLLPTAISTTTSSLSRGKPVVGLPKLAAPLLLLAPSACTVHIA